MNTSFFLQHETNPVDLTRFKSVHQTNPSATVSEKYTFIPTTRVLGVLADYGWFPTKVTESRTRKAENIGFQKHALRLSNNRLNQELAVGSTIPQILLTNSHCGSAAFTLCVALFEKVCQNGLVVDTGNHLNSLRVTHRGYADQLVESSINQISEQIPKVLERVDDFQSISLKQAEQSAFAAAAIELRFDTDKYSVEPEDILRVRHHQQSDPNLWHTYNVVQENLIRGGVQQHKQNGSKIKARAIKAIAPPKGYCDHS